MHRDTCMLMWRETTLYFTQDMEQKVSDLPGNIFFCLFSFYGFYKHLFQIYIRFYKHPSEIAGCLKKQKSCDFCKKKQAETNQPDRDSKLNQQ